MLNEAVSDATVLIESMSTSQLRDMLHKAGYRCNELEQNGAVQLLSAAQGIGFTLRPGNPSKEEGHVVDFCLSCALRVQGGLPANLINEWSQSKRFTRLVEFNEFLVLEMDVVMAGGVSDRHLQAHMQLWDQLLQQYVVFLRDFNRNQSSSKELGSEQLDAPTQVDDSLPQDQHA